MIHFLLGRLPRLQSWNQQELPLWCHGPLVKLKRCWGPSLQKECFGSIWGKTKHMFFFDVLYMFREGCWVKAYTHPLIIYYNAYKNWFVAWTNKFCLACLAPTFYTGWPKKAKCKDGKLRVLISRFSMLGISCLWINVLTPKCSILLQLNPVTSHSFATYLHGNPGLVKSLFVFVPRGVGM